MSKRLLGSSIFRLGKKQLDIILSLGITTVVVLFLLLIPSARAFDLTITNLNGVAITQGNSHTFFLEVSIPPSESVPVQNLELTITGPTPVSASFNALLTSVTKSPQITELVLVGGVNSGFGYGYGYNFGPRPAVFHGYGYNFGSGYGFGYGYGYGFASRLEYRVTINTATMGTGTYSAKLRWNTGASTPSFFESAPVTFTILTPGTVSTAIVISGAQEAALTTGVQAIFGLGVVPTGTATNITASVAGVLTTQLGMTGLAAGQAVTGSLNVAVGNLTLATTNGVGTAVLNLGGGVKVEANAVVTAVSGALQVTLLQPTLRLQPPAPVVATLAGGSAQVTTIGANLGVDLKFLPNGASVNVQFAKDASAFVGQPGTVFQLAARQVGSNLASVSEDVAFLANVTKTGITNADLGNNTVQLQVNKAWYDARLAQGKQIVITKIDENNNVFTQTAVCTVAGDVVNCTVTFTGVAAGLSVFALLAVAQAPKPTEELAPTLPGALPSPTPTPTPVSVARDAGAGATINSDPVGTQVTIANPVIISVTTPNAGIVVITKRENITQTAPRGYSFVGLQINIQGPPATVNNPLRLTFTIHRSRVPAGGKVEVFKDGVLVADCGSTGVASPDPCVVSRSTTAAGDLLVTVLTSQASAWNLGVAQVVAPTATSTPTVPPTATPTVIPSRVATQTPTPTQTTTPATPIVQPTQTVAPTPTRAPPTPSLQPTPTPAPAPGGPNVGLIVVVVVVVAAVGAAAFLLLRRRRPPGTGG